MYLREHAITFTVVRERTDLHADGPDLELKLVNVEDYAVQVVIDENDQGTYFSLRPAAFAKMEWTHEAKEGTIFHQIWAFLIDKGYVGEDDTRGHKLVKDAVHILC